MKERKLWRWLVVLVTLVGLAVATPALADEPPGEVYTTGWNHRGQLGNGTNIDETEAVQVLGLDGGGVVDLAGGRWHSIALADDGTVYTWGRNEFGQLGIGSTGGQRTTAVEVAALDSVTVVDIAAGHYHSLALTDDGDLYIWGRNDTGQLGLGDLLPRGTPTMVSSLSDVAVISGGRNHSAIALVDGSVWTFGDNTQLQLGDGSAVDMATTPVEVSDSTGIEPIVALKAGRDHTLSLSDDGSLWIWGGNIGGQIGNGTDVSQGVPQERDLGGPAIDAAGGAFHTIVAMADGTVQTWGRNAFGQLGIGTTVFSAPTPQTVPAVSTATSVGSGRDHSLITLSDGTALAFGRNDKGQLGDGTQSNRNSPVVILGIGDATVVEGGRGHTRILSTIGGGAPDTTPPTGEWLSPINNQSVNLPVTLTGSAEDNIGVDHVEMVIRDLSTGNFWNPTSGTWGGYNRFTVPVEFPGAATTEFNFVFDPPVPSSLTNYRARLWVEDAVGNENTETLNRNFSVSTSSDTTPPTAAWTSPANGATGPAPVALEGIAEDNVAVDHVELVLRDLNTQLYWDGAAWGSFRRFEVPVADPGSQATTFSYSFDPPTGSGTFRVRVWAVDEAGNDTATTVNRKFSIN